MAIRNVSTNGFRAVGLRAQIAHAVHPADAIARLEPALRAIPNVVAEPAPVISILEFNEYGTQLVVRPFCHTDHYWQVYFDANKAVADAFAAANYPVPSKHQTEYHRQAT